LSTETLIAVVVKAAGARLPATDGGKMKPDNTEAEIREPAVASSAPDTPTTSGT
jgi:hypothetical protein